VKQALLKMKEILQYKVKSESMNRILFTPESWNLMIGFNLIILNEKKSRIMSNNNNNN